LIGFSLGLALVWGGAGCHKTSAQGSGPGYQNSGDPADVNLAPLSGNQPAQVLGQSAQNQSQQQAEDYQQQQAAPIERRYPGANDQGPGNLTDDEAQQVYQADLTDEQANEPPPPLPDYEQPPAPDPDYLWTPGYWAWGPYGYYWVPGAWVEAPYVGALWTPGYWGFYDGGYRFHHGYWGRHVGFYGGINYGFGYIGLGYVGGYWNGDHFFYNRSVNRIDTGRIRNVYDHDERGNVRFAGGVSFNGGQRGVQVRPRAAEIAVMHEQRNAPMPAQEQLRQQSSQNRQQFFSQNKGRPAVAVDARPIASDHRMPAVLPRSAGPATTGPQTRGFQQNGAQPGYNQQRGVTPQAQPLPQGRVTPGAVTPGRSPQNQGPQVQPQNRQQAQPQPGQPQYRRGPETPQAQPQNRPQPQPQQLQTRPQPQQAQPQVRPAAPPQQAQPQFRRGPEQMQARPQAQPQQARPQAQPQQARPQAQPQQARPQPQARQAPPEHQAPAPRPEEKHDR
jgi:hypothetical protein